MSNEDTRQQEMQLDNSSSNTEAENSTSTKRDLATVGGGNIPGGTGYSATHQTDENAEHGSVKNSSDETSPAAINTIDKQSQNNSGGRDPGQPQTPMGDQDATKSRSGEEVADPMTSRAPNKINQKQK